MFVDFLSYTYYSAISSTHPFSTISVFHLAEREEPHQSGHSSSSHYFPIRSRFLPDVNRARDTNYLMEEAVVVVAKVQPRHGKIITRHGRVQ